MRAGWVFLFVSAGCAAPRGDVPEPESTFLRELADQGLRPEDVRIRDREILHRRKSARGHFSSDPAVPGALRILLDRPSLLPRHARKEAEDLLSGRAYAEPRRRITDSETPAWAERLPESLRQPVARLHEAMLDLQAVLDQRNGRWSAPERRHVERYLPSWLRRSDAEHARRVRSGREDVERREALLEVHRLLQRRTEAEHLWNRLRAEAVRAIVDLAATPVAFDKKVRIETPEGAVVFGSSGRDRFSADAWLIVDFGGDDEYVHPASLSSGRVRVVLDLAGNDLYLSRGPHAWGSSLLGAGILVDAAGDDDYHGKDWSLGCGLGGFGWLWDLAGNDRYQGELVTQGAGIYGRGELRDEQGNDFYRAGVFAQGFGSSHGRGALVDRSGNDVYVAGGENEDAFRRPSTWITFAQGAAFSHRFGAVDPVAKRFRMTGQVPGGVGLLVDGGGNDRYEADVFGQGAAYWYSLGILYDGGGNDSYRTTWYGQGVGTHAAAGMLLDLGGDDRYHSYNTSQGCGHDFSVGWLHDASGDDRYFGMGLCQGAGNAAGGLGILTDLGGDDTFRLRSRGWGFARPVPELAPEGQPFGFFITRGGTNRYEGNAPAGAAPGTTWKQPPRGFGVDRR